jgi:hypothetical protein
MRLLLVKLHQWLSRYKEEFYNGYNDKVLVQKLDNEGIEISKAIKNELVEC